MVSQTLNQKSRKLSKRPKSNLTEKIDIPTIDLTADLKYKEKFKSQPKINTKNVPLVNSSELNVLNPQSMILTQTPPSSTLNINRTPKFFSYSTNVDVITPENITNINPEPPPINVSTYNYTGAKQDMHTINTELYNQNQLANQQDYVATTGNQNYALVNGKQEIVVKHHSCDICGKMFKRREHLYQHMKLHTGFRPFVCENCNKSFLRKEHLLRHMIAHSGQKNYTCTICDKSFSRNDNLLKHKKIHSKQSSFTCEVCQKQFVMEHYYFAHKRTHENEKSSQMWGGLLKAI
ncbi:hypothetical protein RI129_012664 [Pyrocoelia pectoralis]|uniref:C2H2-type domain-containing protein n=1 Tax=Pyrocoelia pectoralis TaxID=417401 RepID=A0AAN7V6S4_9COLE